METTTTRRPQTPTRQELHDSDLAVAAVAVPVPPKPRRRWGMLAAMAVAVAVGVLGNVWLLGAVSDTERVVAAGVAIERGEVISREALVSVQVGTDPALSTIPAGDLEALVGQRAAVDIAAGSLLTPASTTNEAIPAGGFSLVGVAVTSSMMPSEPLLAGDRIRIVATPGPRGDLAGEEVTVESAVVVSAVASADVSGQGTQMVVTVEVAEESAPRLAALAVSGPVAIVLDSRDR